MTGQSETPPLALLKRIQADIGDVTQELVDLKMRVNILEDHTQGFMAAQHLADEPLDRMGGRIARIERLDLVEVR